MYALATFTKTECTAIDKHVIWLNIRTNISVLMNWSNLSVTYQIVDDAWRDNGPEAGANLLQLGANTCSNEIRL